MFPDTLHTFTDTFIMIIFSSSYCCKALTKSPEDPLRYSRCLGAGLFGSVSCRRTTEAKVLISSFSSLLCSNAFRKKGSEVTQSCLTLCDLMDCRLPCSSLHGIVQARVLEWVAIFFSRGSSQPRDQTRVSRIVGRHFVKCLNL